MQRSPVRDELVSAIAIMGPTGAGKTSFVNLVTGSNLAVGGTLNSCTQSIQFGSEVSIQGRRVILIDTPGFDDSRSKDANIFRMMTSFLAKSYAEGNKLAGVIYMHRISDVRMGGTASRNFKLAMGLCGAKAMTIVTTFWGENADEEDDLREAELKETFFKNALDNRAAILRHDRSQANAHDIISTILQKGPTPLSIQTELVDQGIPLKETTAAKEIFRQFYRQLNSHEEELKALKTSLQGLAVAAEGRKQVIIAQIEKLDTTIAGMKEEAEGLARIFEEQQQLILQHGHKGKRGRLRKSIVGVVNWLSFR